MKTYLDIEQYSPEWWDIRRGRPTASEFHRIITKKEMKLAAAHKGYACKLIADTFDSLYPRIDRATNDAMREGTRREPESRKWYEFQHDVKVQQVGFCTTDDGRFGCSCDGLVGDDGIAGFKNPTHEVHASYLLNGTLPDDYIAQTYGELWVTGRKWFDFVSYCPDFPAFVVRIEPCGPFWDALTPVLEQFYANYQDALQRIRSAA